MPHTIVITGTASGSISADQGYTGPDGTAIPRLKQLLGQDWYWQEFRALVAGNPSPLWQALVPTPATNQ